MLKYEAASSSDISFGQFGMVELIFVTRLHPRRRLFKNALKIKHHAKRIWGATLEICVRVQQPFATLSPMEGQQAAPQK